MSDQARVYLDLQGKSVPAGTAFFHHGRGQVSTTFTYDTEYLKKRQAYELDPALPLSPAPSTVTGLPGAFQDCSPDRWGRNLVQKEYRRLVQEGLARDRRLTDVDYVLGVSDLTRQGALRFKLFDDADFVTTGSKVPKLISLPALQRAADRVGREDGAAIKDLLDAGTGSLGGARPKASVLGDDGHLMIAKFSHAHDEWSVIAWEKTALELARRARIATPVSTLLTVEGRPVLVLDRFDRASGQRIGYMSAMTATRRSDGEAGDYLDVVEASEDYSRNPRRGHEQIFRRVALSVAIRNTDDHLRNHGFLRRENGWEMSPVFDINPQPDLHVQRQTAINGATEAEHEAEALMELASYCGLSVAQAKQITAEVLDATSTWREVARYHGVSEAELTRFEPMFTAQKTSLQKVAGP